ncbi:PREDICTED: Golgi to ER traffic protein 4 homolog [Acropora digitifera]|uniref:Golgi to ER traffic protein 4 homolog n=1 Tax=Acropora digitifera TaxID=70779 RepID=UPI00077A6552|nr:PREDICTED: Golgi to ER traffic protein 4 homolog [Acropora digitifera]
MATKAGKNTGTQRLLQKLEKFIEDGEYYEAHQLIRTLYFRYKSQKLYKDAIETLHNGACLFLKHKQEGSGNDLAMLMLECFSIAQTPITDDALDKIQSVFELYEPGSVDRYGFITAAIKWTSETDQSLKYGHPNLHLTCAHRFWKEKNFSDSQYHFLFTSDGHQCATMLIESATTRGFPGEADLFVAQAVFQFLCLQNFITANTVFSKYTAQHPDFSGLGGPPYQKPLLNFVWFLLLVIERKGSLGQFTVLCEKYQPSIERDPTYKEYLDKIGQVFFGLPPKPSNRGMMGGILGDIMQSLLEEGGASASASSTTLLASEEVD